MASSALIAPAAALWTASGSVPPRLAYAADDSDALVAELKEVSVLLKKIPAMLDEERWDPARTILKNPPVANLWNLGVSRNTIRKLATARGNDEMIEYVDSVAGALQLADQFIYDNNFVYFQPGNGKVKLKEPKDQVKAAIKYLDEVIALCGGS